MGGSGNSKREGRSNDYHNNNNSHSLPGRYGVHRATASRADGRDEDEVELTKSGRGRAFDSGSNLSSGGGHAASSGGIVVDTEVRVSTEEGPL